MLPHAIGFRAITRLKRLRSIVLSQREPAAEAEGLSEEQLRAHMGVPLLVAIEGGLGRFPHGLECLGDEGQDFLDREQQQGKEAAGKEALECFAWVAVGSASLPGKSMREV